MKNKISKLFYYIVHPVELYRNVRLSSFEKKGDKYSDEEYLKKKFRIFYGRKLNLENPVLYEEKLQWIKMYDRKPLYTLLSDKYRVREYVEKKCGNEVLVPLYGVWDNPDDIDFNDLPNQFVLKCNHNSGLGMYICKDKVSLTENDKKKIISDLKKGLSQDYYLVGREWPYKDIERKVICEKYLGDNRGHGIIDYKFFCFDGVPKCLLIATERAIDVRFDYFDIDLNPLPFEQGGKRGYYNPGAITNFDKMLEIASSLSCGIPHVRVDLYNLDGHIYFGEMTFFDSSGFAYFKPKKWDRIFGEWLKLPDRKD